MKIYTKIIIDMSSGETLHEESFEYEGEVAKCDFGPSMGNMGGGTTGGRMSGGGAAPSGGGSIGGGFGSISRGSRSSGGGRSGDRRLGMNESFDSFMGGDWSYAGHNFGPGQSVPGGIHSIGLKNLQSMYPGMAINMPDSGQEAIYDTADLLKSQEGQGRKTLWSFIKGALSIPTNPPVGVARIAKAIWSDIKDRKETKTELAQIEKDYPGITAKVDGILSKQRPDSLFARLARKDPGKERAFGVNAEGSDSGLLAELTQPVQPAPQNQFLSQILQQRRPVQQPTSHGKYSTNISTGRYRV